MVLCFWSFQRHNLRAGCTSVRSSTDEASFIETKRFLQGLVSQYITISEALLQTERPLKSMGVLSE